MEITAFRDRTFNILPELDLDGPVANENVYHIGHVYSPNDLGLPIGSRLLFSVSSRPLANGANTATQG